MAETEDRTDRNADGDGPAEFFEAMYQGAANGELTLPWDRPAPHPLPPAP